MYRAHIYMGMRCIRCVNTHTRTIHGNHENASGGAVQQPLAVSLPYIKTETPSDEKMLSPWTWMMYSLLLDLRSSGSVSGEILSQQLLFHSRMLLSSGHVFFCLYLMLSYQPVMKCVSIEGWMALISAVEESQHSKRFFKKSALKKQQMIVCCLWISWKNKPLAHKYWQTAGVIRGHSVTTRVNLQCLHHGSFSCFFFFTWVLPLTWWADGGISMHERFRVHDVPFSFLLVSSHLSFGPFFCFPSILIPPLYAREMGWLPYTVQPQRGDKTTKKNKKKETKRKENDYTKT